MTRIVAGTAGGRRLAVPAKGTRPTSERVREALFSAIEAAMELRGARVLDLYAGSGALGIEALSRGAARVTFVESERAALAVLERNLATVGMPGALVRRGKVGAVLAIPEPTPYDLVLADPPYAIDDADLAAMLTALTNGWTRPGSVVVLERGRQAGEPDWPRPLVATRTRRYGDTELHWARHADPGG